MIKPKLKECSLCHEMCVLWVSNPKLCKSCAERSKTMLKQTENNGVAKPFKYQTKAIKKVSTKQQLLNKAYSAQRKVYLKLHPICEVNIEGCAKIATSVHHQKGRIGSLLLDERFWFPTCLHCHAFLESHPEWAKEKGFSLSRLAI